MEWFDGHRWDAKAVTQTASSCEPDHPWERRTFGPPVAASELDAFERGHGIRFPEHYRSFLIDVASGGAGPGYGLLRFDRSDLDDTFRTIEQASTDFYRTPFPHAASFEIPSTAPPKILQCSTRT